MPRRVIRDLARSRWMSARVGAARRVRFGTILLAAAALALASCKTSPARSPRPSTEAPPAWADVAAAYNARASRLTRLWARAVVSAEFTDESGRRRREQGEGHLQVIQPSRLALSAGKLGEVFLWIGCDESCYWFIDAKEAKKAWVGAHSAATREKIETIGLPAAPRELLALTGITPLPGESASKHDVAWGPHRRSLVLTFDDDAVRWRYSLDPLSYEPLHIEVIDAATGKAVITSQLLNYAPVAMRGEGAVPPRVPTRIRCEHHPSGSTLGLSIADMVNSGRGKLRPEVFDFDALAPRLGVREVVDVDAEEGH